MTIMLGGTMLLLVACLVRVVQLETVPNDRLSSSLGRRTRSSVDFAFRGPILDRRGRVLAASVLGWRSPSVCALPSHVSRNRSAAASNFAARTCSSATCAHVLSISDDSGAGDMPALSGYRT